MPIRFKDAHATAPFYLGRINAVLADSSADFDGTSTVSAPVTGTISTDLDGYLASFIGAFDDAPERTGVITASLDTIISDIRSTFAPPSNFTIPDIVFIDAVGDSSHNLRPYYVSVIPAGESVVDIRLVAGTLPAGVLINVNNETLDFNDSLGSVSSASGIEFEVETAGVELATFTLTEF